MKKAKAADLCVQHARPATRIACAAVVMLGLVLASPHLSALWAQTQAPKPETATGKSSDQAALGSPDFSPSPQCPVGWRGDGSGRYPGANPPVHWGRSLKQLADLKCAAATPKDESSAGATPTTQGFFTEWLVAGPIPCEDAVTAIKEELLPGEAKFAPRDGDKLGDATWKTVKADDSLIDVWKALGTMNKEQAAYAQTCLYSDKPLKIWFHLKCGGGHTFWFNGELKHSLGNIWPDPVLELDLKAGWNRFLFKLVPDCAGDYANSCYTRCRFWPATEPRDYEEKNIAWMVSMPGLSQDTPVICGERIFTMAYPYNLVCLDKKTGKILWIRPNGPYDAATADDRKAKPDLFVKMDALAAKRETYYHNFIAGSMPTPQGVKEENDLEKELDKLMLDVDTRYRRPKEQGEPDWWTIPTPTTDGHNVCVWLTRGISAAYDLEGNRRWICYQRTRDQHHGYFCSPVIADGKFVRYDGQLTALDMNDGSVKWSVDDGKPSYNGSNLWFGSLSRGGILGGKEYIVGPGGAMMVRASDGKVFGKFGYGDATTVFTGDTLLWTIQDFIAASSVKVDSADGGLTITPGKKVSWTRAQLLGCPNMYQGHWLEASPLVYDGLGYAVSGSGVLVVFDAKTMEPVYTKALQLDLFHYAGRSDYVGAAVTLAGHYIYLSGSTGVTVVIKPGRTYEEVARNRIQILTRTAFWEDASTHYPQGATGHTLGDYKYFCYGAKYCPEYQDCTMTSTPIFDGSRMYFRGGQYLYCIEEKGRQ